MEYGREIILLYVFALNFAAEFLFKPNEATNESFSDPGKTPAR